jgi:hypothetical protein
MWLSRLLLSLMPELPDRRAIFRPARKLTGLHFICCSFDSGPQSLHLRDVLIQLPDLSQEPLNNIVASQAASLYFEERAADLLQSETKRLCLEDGLKGQR